MFKCKICWVAMTLLVLSGCGNTMAGAEKDTRAGGENTAQGAKQASDRAMDTAGNLSAAATLTPKIKLAIAADSQLNDPRNSINVDSTATLVSLDGFVATSSLKDLAGEIAMKALADAGAKQTFENNLVVKP
jgi:osmotically-inducible protein OsmY